ncbi:MAG TPA: murein biosynthesis integral membrane protein MurJ [Acidimicrobiales bacterium]|nr:murein biosynthesis integral membrane protein MurJ [Acidimicrobiales bacterium]
MTTGNDEHDQDPWLRADPYERERHAPRPHSPYAEDGPEPEPGWYEPDAPTIEMPILDEMLLQQSGPRLRTRADDQVRPTRRPSPPRPGRPPPPEPPPEEEEQPSSSKSSRLVAIAIFLSSCAGLVRETVIASFLGTGPAADAFKAALRIPNMLQNLLGEGVLSASFIPVYARLRDEGNEREAGRLAGAIAGLLLVITGIISLVGVMFAEPIARVLVTGFEGETFALTVRLVRIMFPGIGFLVLSAWCLGVLNSHRKFFLSYIAPVLWNAAQIAALFAAGLTHQSQWRMATALAWGVLVGGLLQLLVQLRPVLGLLGRNMRLSLDTRSAPVRSVVTRFMPVIVGKGIVQFIIYIDLWLASFLATGAVSSLFYALLLYQLPISMFGLGVAAAELPDLSQVSVHDPETRRLFRRRLEDGMARIAFYVLPIATMYVVVGDVIVGAIFQRGKFGWDDTWGVWLALAVFAIGLPATTSSRLLQNGLYALDDPKTPPRLSVIRVVVSTVVSLAVMFPLDRLTIGSNGVQGWDDFWAVGPLPSSVRLNTEFVHLGLIAFAIGATVAAIVEYRMLARAVAWRIGRTRMAGRWLNPIAASCAVSATVAFGLVTVLPNSWPALLLAPLVLGPAGVVYLVMTRWLQVPEAAALTARLPLPGLGR